MPLEAMRIASFESAQRAMEGHFIAVAARVSLNHVAVVGHIGTLRTRKNVPTISTRRFTDWCFCDK